jgi:hypothetical protein
MIRLLIPLFALAALGACASTPTYTAAASPTASGYSETRVESDRYFVTYNARSGADARLIEDYALLRAAEVTIEQGRDWFIVDRRTVDASESRNTGPSIGVGVGGGSYGRRSGGGASIGFSIPLGGGSGAQAHSATLEIRMGQGAKPDDANAYDARAVASSLRQRLVAAQ